MNQKNLRAYTALFQHDGRWHFHEKRDTPADWDGPMMGWIGEDRPEVDLGDHDAVHLFTTLLPEEYQLHGDGVSFFSGEIDHPRALVRTDLIGGKWTLVWVSADEIRPVGYGGNATQLTLMPNSDPNAGVEFTGEDEYDQLAGDLMQRRLFVGGTPNTIQSFPAGLTPYFIGMEELPGANFGGGSAQIDLLSDTFDWAQ